MPAPKDKQKREEWLKKVRAHNIQRSKISRNNWIKKICKYCKKEFKIPHWKYKEGKGIYCSKKCYTEDSNNTIEKKCLKCGKKFKTYGSQNFKYCSSECRYNSKVYICNYCKKEFKMGESLNRKYCSNECYHKDMVGKSIQEKSNSWKGNKAGYSAFHDRVEKIRGKPKKCEDCGTTSANKFEWANISGKFDDVNDYKRLCTSCHRKFDNKKK